MMEFIHVKGLPDVGSIKGIQELHREVFDESELSIGELQEKLNLLCCMALDGRKAIGFKLGYEKEVGVFYSWYQCRIPWSRDCFKINKFTTSISYRERLAKKSVQLDAIIEELCLF
ncbi:hypothetical protein ACIQ4I_17065 [Rummeliibacillus sp. NPDC094406]|uniref:hypothetical protein n=1 Tax=Rummeliibacillus sp. NPDC094406 TaxID=3364511 RepID=UPI00381E7628